MSLTKTPTSMIDVTGATAGQVLTFNNSTSTWVASAAPGAASVAMGSLRAWVNFNGVYTSALSYTRTGTTVTVTHNSHGFVSGMIGEFTGATDTNVNGSGKVITVINANSYSFQTTATGANGTLTQRSMIYAGSNVSSIVSNTIGDYTLNFTNEMPDKYYAVSCNASIAGVDLQSYQSIIGISEVASFKTTSSVRLRSLGDTNGAVNDKNDVSVTVIR